MAGSINKAIIIGNLGKDPEIRSTQDGREIASLSVATSESWKDRHSGERKERTEWHRVVIFSEGLVNVAKNYLRKGSKVYLEAQIQTRKWTDKDGAERYSTELVLQGFDAKLVLLDAKKTEEDSGGYDQYGASSSHRAAESSSPLLDDKIPFGWVIALFLAGSAALGLLQAGGIA